MGREREVLGEMMVPFKVKRMEDGGREVLVLFGS